MDLWGIVANHIARVVGRSVDPIHTPRMIGGSTARATIFETAAGKYFVKIGRPEQEQMFAAEAEGLRTIRDKNVIRVPNPVCLGSGEGTSFLVLEYLDLVDMESTVQTELGRRLAA